MRATVVVITTAGHLILLESRYVIRYIADYWRGRGIHFDLATNPGPAPSGDIAWQHLDMTVVAGNYQQILSRYPVVINGGHADVHKHRTASHLVTRDDEWDGPVIVKTDLNFGGKAEDWGYRRRVMRHPWFHALRDCLPVRLTGRIGPEEYPLFSSKSEVPGWMWRDRRLVVQRFMAEREGGRYGIRRWFRALRTKLRLDFGKIDYGEVDARPVVYDVNPAVSSDGPVDSTLQREMGAAPTPGLESFLESAGL